MDSTAVSAYAATVQALTAIILVWLTGRYVRLTAGMVAEMRAARQPLVFVDIEIEGNSVVVLIIGNSGDAPARHIKFGVDDGIPWQGQVFHRPADLPAVRDGIPYLAPSRSLRFMLGHLDWKRATEQRGWLNLSFKYMGEEGRKFEQSANIDLLRYNGVKVDSFVTPLHEISDTIRMWAHLAQDDILNARSQGQFQKACPTCATPLHHSARKCPACLEWLAKPEGDSSEPSAPAS